MSSLHRTTCKHGHAWIPENLYTNPTTGQVVCRECMREANRRVNPNYKQKLADLKALSKRLDEELHEAIARRDPTAEIQKKSSACLRARQEVLRFERDGHKTSLTSKEALTKRQKAKVREQNVANRMTSANNPLRFIGGGQRTPDR